jgi:hypothetical protein
MKTEEEHKQIDREYYLRNKEKINIRQKEYYLKTKEIRQELARQHYQENKNQIRAYQRNYRKENPEKVKSQVRKYNKNNYKRLSEQVKEHHRLDREKFPEKYIVRNAKSRAKKKGLPFNITISDIIIPKTCPILGTPIFKSIGTKTQNTPSLDRIKPMLGYVKGNIQIISHLANLMKQDASLEQIVCLGDWAKNMLKK